MNLGCLLVAEVPDLTEEEATDLILLRKEYGIGAREAFTELPAWEVQLLVAAARPMGPADMDHDVDPFDAPPKELSELFDLKE